MQAELDEKTGYLHPVLKRSFNTTFELLGTENPVSAQHLQACYLNHHHGVLNYFSNRNDLLKIDVSQSDSLKTLLSFLKIPAENAGSFPKLNIGNRVDNWKEFKHPNKINSLSAGIEHRKFFDYK
jgi:hypothetical protein